MLHQDRLGSASNGAGTARNPYEGSPAAASPEDCLREPARADQGPRDGTAIYIALFTLIGTFPGLPLLANDNALGLLGVGLGAMLGGVVYRIRSRTWPIDPTARARRQNYALAAAIVLPILMGLVASMNMQGLAWAFLSILVGAAVAGGILVERRSAIRIGWDP